ncbi:hypothetical protein BOTBODRAFT_191810 [Botryobasidium botryosum FD-172 SS1]|uniref:F-box domain-containing protein n=1 Tax=Botryobasidium botryosum (strain FD-172 SS1) TaxID=930990 RepID=A0A067M0X2_BOTB1|nr:hypothetical protein BOTBODRAFT_191810 [Botryobasidium botryosum FD-172 SS1]
MDDIALNMLPHFIKALWEQAYNTHGEGGREPAKELFSFSTKSALVDFRIPNMGARSVLEHADKELRTMELACNFALHAVTSYTDKLLSATRNHRNHSTAIYGLPNELVSVIFEFAKSTASDPEERASDRTPINLSQVSRRWRDIALTMPALWTTVDAAGAHRDLFIERSKPRLLDIVLPDYVSNSIDDDCIAARLALEAFIPHLERWGRLSLKHIKLETLNLPPAPNLHSLYIYHSSLPLHSYISLVPIHIPFTRRPPSLRRLSLIGRSLPITSSMLVDLEELCFHKTVHQSGAELLGILAACPRLRRFRADRLDFADPFDRVARSNPECIALLHLNTMELIGISDDTIRGILSSITVPSALALGIETNKTLGRLLPPAAIIEKCLPNLLSVRTLCLEARMDDSEVWFTGKSFGDDNILLKIIFYPSDSLTLPEIIESIASEFGQHMPGLPLHTLSLLQIHDHYLSCVAFVALISNLSTLAVLSLDECNAPSFLVVLILTPTTQLCPSLQSLRLRQSCIHKNTLIEVANSRRDRLLRIDITRCNGIDGDLVLELKRVPVEIHWVQ